MTRATATQLSCALIVLLLTLLPAAAAPTLPDAAGTSPSSAGDMASDSPDRSGAAGTAAGMNDIPDQSRTIRMLLEMQTSSAAAEAEERKRQQEKEGRAAAARLAPVRPPAGPLSAVPPLAAGSDLEKVTAPSAEELRAQQWIGAVGAPAGISGGVATDGTLRGGGTVPIQAPDVYSGPRQTASTQDGERRVIRLLPPELIRWLREYRIELIAGSVVLLVIASVGTSIVSRRPR